MNATTQKFETNGFFEDGHVEQLGEHENVDAARAHALTCLATERELKEVDICPLRSESPSPVEAAIETVRR